MENKITRKSVLTKALEVEVFSAEEIEVIKKMIASLDKKSTGKPTKAQIANEGIRTDILAVLADGRARTATEIGAELGISCQKASALVKPLVEGGKVTKVIGKGKEPTRFVVGE